MLSSIPAEVAAFLRTAGAVSVQLGVPGFAVGGFVRDLLLGRQTQDIDLVVEGDGVAYAKALGEACGAAVTEVPQFGTAHLVLLTETGGPLSVDVATARRESYAHAGALPKVAPASLREDLHRRDFSINALAMPLGAEFGQVLDYFGGLHDLQEGVIRILHDQSFIDDPTRILRAVRFANRYGFRLDPKTARLAQSAALVGAPAQVSMDRLRTEFIRILQEPCSGRAVAMLHRLNLAGVLLPGVDLSEDAYRQADAVESLQEQAGDLYRAAAPWLTKLMVLLRKAPVAVALEAVQRLRLRRDESQSVGLALAHWREVLGLVSARMAAPADVVEALAGWQTDGLLFLVLLGGAEHVLHYFREWRHVRLAIDGRDLLQLGMAPGPVIGVVLRRVLADRLNGQVPDRESQLAAALHYADAETGHPE